MGPMQTEATATAALMLVQSMLLALLERGKLTGEDVLGAIEDVLAAQRGMRGEATDEWVLREAERIVRHFAERTVTALP